MSRLIEDVTNTSEDNGARRGGEDGQVLAEYSLILGLITLLAITLLHSMGATVSALLSRAAGAF